MSTLDLTYEIVSSDARRGTRQNIKHSARCEWTEVHKIGLTEARSTLKESLDTFMNGA